MQVPDTSAIQRLIRTARRRIRGQWALEGATTATILASATALAAVFLMRLDVVGTGAGIALLVVAVLVIAIGAVIKAMRRLDDETVARRIDRASNLADRLSTAIAFSREPAPAPSEDDADADETEALRVAAIRDGVRAVPRADVRIATPFVAPADLRAALGFLVISALAAGLALPKDAPPPAPPGVAVEDPQHDAAIPSEKAVALDPDDKAYFESLIAQIRAAAQRDNVPELEDFAKQIEQLLKQAELGKITKEQMLDAWSKAEAKLNENAEPDQAELDKKMAELGKELSKSELTKELGNALQKTDLDKAKAELEKLAEKLAKNELTEKQKEELAKQLDNKIVRNLADSDTAHPQGREQQKKLEDEIRRLEKKQAEAKTEQEKLEAERQLNKKKDELQKLDKDQQAKEQSAQRQALKRLSRDMEKAAESLQKPQKDPNGQNDKQEQEQRDQQASQKLKDAARETGRVDQDRRKQATQKKMSSQMDDLREAMQRAKQKGNNKSQDPFGKQGKNQDFAQRARGQRGQSGSWKPGQGKQPGQGQGQGQQGQGQNGQGQPQQGGSEWGVGHDDNLTGDPTDKSGNTKDADLQGKQGTSGGGTRETILSAAQKGFASQRYKDVYGKYQQIVEDVMRTEKLPSSYKYYVKKYFAKIHPTTEAPASSDSPSTATKDQAP